MTLVQVLKDIAPILAVVLPAIAAFFAYRRQENLRGEQLRRGGEKGEMSAFAGALVDKGQTDRWIAAMETLAGALADAAGELRVVREQRHVAQQQTNRLLDELADIRRALEEMASVKRRRPPSP